VRVKDMRKGHPVVIKTDEEPRRLFVSFDAPALDRPLSVLTGEGQEETERCSLPPAVGSPRPTLTVAMGYGRMGWPRPGRPLPRLLCGLSNALS
jgi:hypothetical protein